MAAVRLELRIPSETSRVTEVQDQILSLVDRFEYPARDAFRVRLAIEEALVNAIKHGNGMDPLKQVRIDCTVNERIIQIEIEDEGPGFQVEAVPDPTADENLDRPCGRGIMLIRSFMNLVRYENQGRLVYMEKERDI